jgi:predicted O-methyltransferase YrrM
MIYHNVYTKAAPHMTFQEILMLYGMVKSLPINAKILEVGAWKGGSTIPMGVASLGTERKITVVDIWDDPSGELFKTWHENVTMEGIFDMLEVRRGDSLLMMRDLLADKRLLYYDFCFLDTSHEYNRTNLEFEMALELVKDGGWIFMHDIGDEEPYLYPGCTKVWYEKAQFQLENHKKINALYGGQKR